MLTNLHIKLNLRCGLSGKPVNHVFSFPNICLQTAPLSAGKLFQKRNSVSFTDLGTIRMAKRFFPYTGGYSKFTFKFFLLAIV